MANAAARAYGSPRYREFEPSYRPDLRVLPGRERVDYANRIGVSPLFMTCLKIGIMAIIFIAIVGVCRVWFTSQTVASLMEADALSTQIAEARATGDELEVQQTVLSNSTRVQSYAAENLGMVPTYGATEYIDLAAGALAVDSAGNLSLAGSIAVLDAEAEPAPDTVSAEAESVAVAEGVEVEPTEGI